MIAVSCVSPLIRYFSADVPHVLQNVAAQAGLGIADVAFPARHLQCVEGLERELGVDHQLDFGIGKRHEAVGPVPLLRMPWKA